MHELMELHFQVVREGLIWIRGWSSIPHQTAWRNRMDELLGSEQKH